MNTLTRFQPFNGFNLFRDLDDVLKDFAGPAATVRGDDSFLPRADIYESKTALELKLDLPGFTPEELKVEIEGDTLTVSAERKREERKEEDGGWIRTERSHGVFARSFVLPENVDGSKPEAKYTHGVLTLTLPKREEAKPKKIEVKVG